MSLCGIRVPVCLDVLSNLVKHLTDTETRTYKSVNADDAIGFDASIAQSQVDTWTKCVLLCTIMKTWQKCSP